MFSSKYEEVHVTTDIMSQEGIIKEYKSKGYKFICGEPIGRGEIRLSFIKVSLPKIEEKDDYEDKMIRASRKSGVTKQDLMDAFTEKGLVGVYNLGLKNMLDYLNGN